MKAGFVALVGLPNAGKSTLVNALIGEKVGIVSKKPQTTRKRVIGILNSKDTQICFVDSPGRIQAEQGLNQFLEQELNSVIADSDVCVAVLNIDARKMTDLMEIAELTKKSGKPWLIVINKMDLNNELGEGVRDLKLKEALSQYQVPILFCSAATESKHDQEKMRAEIVSAIEQLLPESEAPLFDAELFTTQTSKDLVAEIVREKCFEYLHQEIPYGIAVKVLKYDESKAMPRIYVDIVVAKENFLPIVVGRGGQVLKRIGASARIEYEKLIGQKVYLETHVKVKKDWTKKPEIMKELGYAIDK